jgi:hypothetical protein
MLRNCQTVSNNLLVIFAGSKLCLLKNEQNDERIATQQVMPEALQLV